MTDQITFTLAKGANTITTNTGQSYPLNPSHEFDYEGTTYILYNFTTTLIKHKVNSFSNVSMKYFDTPLIMSKELAELSIFDMANLTQFQLELSDESGKSIGSQATLPDTLHRLKSNTINSLTHNNSGLQLDDSLKQIVELLLSRVKDYDPQNMIKSLPHVTKINKIYPRNTTSSTVLSDLVKYIVYHNTLHDAIVDNRGLTIFPDTLFLLALIGVLLNSKTIAIEGALNLCSVQELLIHSVIEITFNIITMRLDKELFIEGRNTAAKQIKSKFYSKIPNLANQKNLNVLLSSLNNNPKFTTMLQEESVEMYPYIALYGQSDKVRVKTCYTECRKNKDLAKNCEYKISWIHPDTFIELLQQFTDAHSTDYVRYDTDKFIKIISKFMVDPVSPNDDTMMDYQ